MAKLPDGYQQKLDVFEKLLIVKIFRPEKVMLGVVNYVQHYLGKFYLEPPQVSMDKLYADSDVATPIIFVLSQGADPTSQITGFADKTKMSNRLQTISLGQGQGPKALRLIQEG